MADTTYKFTLFFTYVDQGWSESYFTTTSNVSDAEKRLRALLNARANLQPQSQSLEGVRVSIFGPNRQSVLLIPPDPVFPQTDDVIHMQTQGVLSDASYPPDITNVCVEYQVQFNGGRKALRYLALVPDAFTTTDPGGYSAAASPAYWRQLEAWFLFLKTGGWQVRARNFDSAFGPFTIQDMVIQSPAPSLVGLVLSTGVSPTPSFALGDFLQVTHMRAAKGVRASTMNGRWRVAGVNNSLVSGSTVVYLAGSAGIDIATQRLTPSTAVRKLAFGFFGIEQATISRVRTHRRGRPSLSPRGRRLTVRSLEA